MNSIHRNKLSFVICTKSTDGLSTCFSRWFYWFYRKLEPSSWELKSKDFHCQNEKHSKSCEHIWRQQTKENLLKTWFYLDQVVKEPNIGLKIDSNGMDSILNSITKFIWEQTKKKETSLSKLLGRPFEQILNWRQPLIFWP